MGFKKSDLEYSDYSWTALPNDDPKITGKPDSTRFSRYEGYEMLYMIDKVLEHRDLTSVRSGQKVESIIRTELPSTTQSQEKVFNFVNDNW
ncbi:MULTISPECIES: hypothetical protein [Pseudoalteromonas]|uniref:Uncharacterized protein n=1 Tax=Pseudoalteromonas amylolytica TaxID=1859457 RepID=A0A1S1MPB5_9GAMM|nr:MULTISPECIES: hypothetical protein [Pseudoalteromonas]OHU87016.1 hypothetical protein BFC16_13195 [Pseudoalteromonas sp. JW3]OHU88275.1 hypothetical protein BET10_19565 [Pseudoalteromonas amylolytica]